MIVASLVCTAFGYNAVPISIERDKMKEVRVGGLLLFAFTAGSIVSCLKS